MFFLLTYRIKGELKTFIKEGELFNDVRLLVEKDLQEPFWLVNAYASLTSISSIFLR